MKILLDTNALIWWLEDNPRLGSKARSYLGNAENEILATIVSLWEITVKFRVGKMARPGSAFVEFLAKQSISVIGIEPHHIAALEKLPHHHNDPFDHLIAAQALAEGAILLTSDKQMPSYGIRCIGVS